MFCFVLIKIIDEEDVVNLEDWVNNNIFLIKEDNNFANEIRLELEDIKDQFIDNIKNEAISKIKEPSEIYPKMEKNLFYY